MKLTDFKVLSLDCYGTLIDWETGLLRALADLRRARQHPLGDDQVLAAFARHESAQQAQTPTMLYRDLLQLVYARIADEWGLEASDSARQRFGQSVADWPAFEDSPAALAYLQQHYRLVILSNVDNRSFAASSERLGIQFDAVCTAEDIGSYKPADANFEYLFERMAAIGYGKDDILHTAESLFHDHAPANRHGLASCLIHRRHAKDSFGATSQPAELPQWAFRFTSMGEMAQAHRAQLHSARN